MKSVYVVMRNGFFDNIVFEIYADEDSASIRCGDVFACVLVALVCLAWVEGKDDDAGKGGAA